LPKLALAFDVTANTGQASRSLDRLGDKVDRTGKRFHGFAGSAARPLLALAGAGGVGALIGSSVKLAASFETTMRQIAVATHTPAAGMKNLSDLALKMGADTTFSAKDAGNAMLELARGGLTAAEIKGGALGSTLTLAAAGSLELGEAAGFVVQGLKTFNLGADKAASVAAALAGGANASTASVQDMGLALSQVGPGAVTAGLSLQETTAVLAAFAQNGIKGSDAGTSLKTMLTRLVPMTKKSASEMKKLGLNFIDANGEFKSITDIAEQLHDRLGPLSAATRKQALATIFGSDAERAATILTKEGAKGLEKFIKATNDKTQAEQLAKAATSGTAGALEQMKGSIETAQIALGTALAPAVTDIAKKISAFASGPLTHDVIPAIGKFVEGVRSGEGPGGKLADVVGEIGDAAETAWSVGRPFLSFIADHPKLFTNIAVGATAFGAAMKVIGSVKKLPGLGSLASKATPLPVFVVNNGVGVGGTPGKGGGKGGSKLPVTPLLLGIGSVALTSGDAGPLTGKQKEWHDFAVSLQKLIDVERGTSKSAREQGALLAKAFNKGNRQDLTATYDLLVKYGKKTTDVKVKIAELAKDPTVTQALQARAAQQARNVALLSGGLLKVTDLANTSSTKISASLGNGFIRGVRVATDSTDKLDTTLTDLGNKRVLPTLDLKGAGAAKSDAVGLLGYLRRLDSTTATPKLGLDISPFQRSMQAALAAKLDRLDGRALGGPVRAGQAYMVGEREPELFVPDRNGQILNQRQMAAAGVGGGGLTINGGIHTTYTGTQSQPKSVADTLRDAVWLRGF